MLVLWRSWLSTQPERHQMDSQFDDRSESIAAIQEPIMSARRAFMCGRGRHRFPGVCQGPCSACKSVRPESCKSASSGRNSAGGLQNTRMFDPRRTRHYISASDGESRRSSRMAQRQTPWPVVRSSPRTAVKTEFFHTRPSDYLAVVGRSCLTTQASCYLDKHGWRLCRRYDYFLTVGATSPKSEGI